MYVEKLVSSVKAAIDSATSDRHRRMLELALQHIEGEHVELSIDRVMATMIPEPRYGFYGFGGKEAPQGGAAVRGFYEALGPNLLGDVDIEVENLFVSDTGVMIEGVFVY